MNSDTGRNDFVLLDGEDLPQDDVSLTIDEFEELHIEKKATGSTPIQIFDVQNEKTIKIYESTDCYKHIHR
jgi:hypothetical protein